MKVIPSYEFFLDCEYSCSGEKPQKPDKILISANKKSPFFRKVVSSSVRGDRIVEFIKPAAMNVLFDEWMVSICTRLFNLPKKPGKESSDFEKHGIRTFRNDRDIGHIWPEKGLAVLRNTKEDIITKWQIYLKQNTEIMWI